MNKAVGYFQQAIQQDPANGLAYAGLSDAYDSLGALTFLSPGEAFPKGKAAATKALEIDDTIADAHADLAYAIWYYEWDWRSAEIEFKCALELNPNSAISHSRYAVGLAMQSRFDESIAESRRAQELDPLSPAINEDAGYNYLVDRRYREAIDSFQKATELDPGGTLGHAELSTAYTASGNSGSALAEFEKVKSQIIPITTDNQNAASQLGWLYALSGRRTEALQLIKEFEELSSHSYVDYYFIATIDVGLGDKDQTFQWLEKAYKQHSNQVAWLAVDPFWYPIHSDPHYKDRVGLPQPK